MDEKNESTQNIVLNLNGYFSEISAFVNQYNEIIVPNSKASNEITSYKIPVAVITAYSQASILIEASADYFGCFIKTITEPILPISMYSCIRSIIESSSIAIWLMDPKVDIETRVYRSLVFRKKGLEQQNKCLQNINDDHEIEIKIKERINLIEKRVIDLDLDKIVNKKGEKKNFGLIMPTFVEIINQSMGSGLAYRLLSLVVHNHPSVLAQTSFKKITKDFVFNGLEIQQELGVYLEKSVDVSLILLLSKFGLICFSKPLWMKCCLWGWDEKQLTDILEKYSEHFGIEKEFKFWLNKVQ